MYSKLWWALATGHCQRIPSHWILPELSAPALTPSLPATCWPHTQGYRGKLKTWFCLGESSWILCICSRPDPNHSLWNYIASVVWPLGKWVLEPSYLSSNPDSTDSYLHVFDLGKVMGTLCASAFSCAKWGTISAPFLFKWDNIKQCLVLKW